MLICIQSVWNVVHENMKSTANDRSKKKKLAKEKRRTEQNRTESSHKIRQGTRRFGG